MDLSSLSPILETVSDGMLVVCTKFSVLKMNKAAEDILGPGCEGLLRPPIRENRLPMMKVNKIFKQTISAVKPQMHSGGGPLQIFGSFHFDGKQAFSYEQMPVQRAMRGEVVEKVELMIRNRFRPEGVRLLANARPVYDEHGQMSYVICCFTDVSAAHASEQRSNIFRQVFAQTQEAIVITDASFIVQYANKSFWDLTGSTPERTLNQPFAPPQEEYGDGSSWLEIQNITRKTGSWSGEFVIRKKTSELLPLWASLRAVVDSDKTITNYVLTLADLTSLKSSQEELYRIVNKDTVTGLNNRQSFFEDLDQTIERARKQEERFALIFMDIQRFKELNDSLGHEAGDKVLQKIADRLSFMLRQDDCIARLGGDEFAMIAADCSNDLDLAMTIERIRNAVEAQMQIEEHLITPNICIGAAVFPDDGQDALTLAKHADIALTSATNYGAAVTQLYTETMNNNISRHFWVENNLRNAFGSNQLIPYFQPQLNLANMKPEEAEVLIRWKHPQTGLINPGEFIPVAERTGLIGHVTWEVMEASCQLALQWKAAGMPLSLIAINISANLLLENTFMDGLYQTIEKIGITPSQVLIEITESSAMADPDLTSSVLKDMKDYGLSLAIDDFGTGYSSLAYLKKFAVDQIKIDQSFVKDLSSSQESRSIVKAIIRMCETLGYETLAEGVETGEQARILQELGCNKLQGYLIAKPLSADEFEAFMRENGQGLKNLQSTSI